MTDFKPILKCTPKVNSRNLPKKFLSLKRRSSNWLPPWEVTNKVVAEAIKRNPLRTTQSSKSSQRWFVNSKPNYLDSEMRPTLHSCNCNNKLTLGPVVMKLNKSKLHSTTRLTNWLKAWDESLRISSKTRRNTPTWRGRLETYMISSQLRKPTVMKTTLCWAKNPSQECHACHVRKTWSTLTVNGLSICHGARCHLEIPRSELLVLDKVSPRCLPCLSQILSRRIMHQADFLLVQFSTHPITWPKSIATTHPRTNPPNIRTLRLLKETEIGDLVSELDLPTPSVPAVQLSNSRPNICQPVWTAQNNDIQQKRDSNHLLD